jgi:hypothetical protein
LIRTIHSVSILAMLRSVLWKRGPAEPPADGPLVISLTNYHTDRWRHVPGVWMSGLRLRRAWPAMQGAVGLWLWADPLRRRSGAISVWTNEDDLGRFVRWPVHVAIMRKYRERGTLEATSWTSERFEKDDILGEARRRLGS